VKVSKKINKNSICSELSKITMLPKKHFGPLGFKKYCLLVILKDEFAIVECWFFILK